ncbi:protein NO VEIN domain-containing protein, partial [Burkholderia sp. SIMBA_042]|uniref:protein NO VEIN domain-containing protein n=1 Tax=Burkholderia sp. SIMBA_042 TaxID=3085783 RepID=UPI00397DF5C3
MRYYESEEGGNRTVSSVEEDNVGWDLTVTGGDVTLKVEVKGLSGHELCVELTPNEYKQMVSPEHRAMYAVYVVTGALS